MRLRNWECHVCDDGHKDNASKWFKCFVWGDGSILDERRLQDTNDGVHVLIMKRKAQWRGRCLMTTLETSLDSLKKKRSLMRMERRWQSWASTSGRSRTQCAARRLAKEHDQAAMIQVESEQEDVFQTDCWTDATRMQIVVGSSFSAPPSGGSGTFLLPSPYSSTWRDVEWNRVDWSWLRDGGDFVSYKCWDGHFWVIVLALIQCVSWVSLSASRTHEPTTVNVKHRIASKHHA